VTPHPKASAAGLRRSPRTGRARVACTLLLLGSLAALAGLLAAPALADRSYECQITGSSSPSATECNGTGNSLPGGGSFSELWGLTVDSGDHLWVSDTGHGRLTEFDSSGSLLAQIGESEGAWGYGGYIRSPAYSKASNRIYVADSGGDDLWSIDSGAHFSADIRGAWGTGCCYLYAAADNSGGPTDGTVYVASSTANGTIFKIDGAGNPVNFSASAPYISGDTITASPVKSFSFGSEGGRIAVDGSGHLIVSNSGQRTVEVFAPSGEFLFELAETPEGPFGSVRGVAVDPTSENILVVDSNKKTIDEFDSSGEFVSATTGATTPTGEFSTSLRDVAVDFNGRLYVSDSGQQVVDRFGPNAILPKISYGAVSNQTQTSGTLNASIDLNGGGEVTSCVFEYGTTATYGTDIPCTPAVPYTSNTGVSANVSGLMTETNYHYRVVVTNANGTKKGADQIYLPHAVAGLTTDAPTNVARNTATLNASFNGNGEDTHYYFEWGTSTAYGNTTATPPGLDAGSPSGHEALSFDLTGLQVETSYHYRVVASNLTGISHGGDQSFKTQAAVAGLSTDPADGITASGATLHASYTGIGEDVHYYFQWGLTTAYGAVTAQAPGADAGSGSGAQQISTDLGQLQVNTLYHYRVVASDAAGITIGADRTVRTLGRYEFAGYFGSAGSGDGQLSSPRDIAVSASNGDIYVADTGNHRIVRFDSQGNFISTWGWGVEDGAAEFEVCTSGCQAGLGGSSPGEFETARYVEVDNSEGPSAGDVYVGDSGDALVQKFDASGDLIESWGTEGQMDFVKGGQLRGITVGTAGDLFAVTSDTTWTQLGQDGVFRSQIKTEAFFGLGSPGGGGIEVDTFGGYYEAQPSEEAYGVRFRNPASAIYSGHAVPTQANAGLAIDRASNDLYVNGGSYIEQFATDVPPGCSSANGGGLSGLGCGATDTFGEGDLSGATGLAFDPSTRFVYAANTSANNVAFFSPLPVPAVETGGAEKLSPASAKLTGHLDPGGGQVSECYFEYGPEETYGSGVIPCTQTTPIGSAIEVSAELGGLEPFSTYHYRLVAIDSNGKGFPAYGHDRTFTVVPEEPPVVSGASSMNESPSGTTLSADINPHSAPTFYRFEYGPGAGYGLQTPLAGPLDEDEVDHSVSVQISNLSPGMTYHFRAVAFNFGGMGFSPDQTFSTPNMPTVASSGSIAVTQTTATVSARLLPGFRSTTYHFDYGTSSVYGLQTQDGGSIGADNEVHVTEGRLSGLTPGTTYHFRVVAANVIGTTKGPDQVFMTLPPSSTVPPPPGCRKGFVKKHGDCVKKKRHKRRGRHGSGTQHRRHHRG
jgi:DNA-binding beta-propeller fold protein YncE